MRKILLVILILLVFGKSFSQVNDTLTTKTDSVKVAPAPPVPSSAPATNAQRRDQRPMSERIDFGFGTGFWITPSQTYVEISPVLAYRFPKTLITGFGYRYIYRHERTIGRDLNAYGPNFIARVNLLPRIYFWTEYEILHSEYFTEIAGAELVRNTATTDSWFAGLGYIRSLGKKGRGGISMQVLYNVLYDREVYSPYYSAFTYRVGYFF